ncbi:MAG: V-type ATPase subunit [Thermoplasmata archaeon]|nr:MAG: V-type ATPase subunit [Thermoplasmata archaeon]
MGIIEVIEELGLNSTLGLALVVIGGAILITIILLMSYFNVLVSIASFAYPNARLRAMGNPYVRKNRIAELMELAGLTEVAQELAREGYKVPPNIESAGLLETERELELAQVNFLRKTLASSPLSMRPFLESFLIKYDAAQIKKVLRARKNASSNEELKKRLIPVKTVDEEVIDSLLETTTVDEVANAVKNTRFGDILIKAASEHKGDIVAMDLVLDKFFFTQLSRSITRVDTAVRETVTFFVGRYIDFSNIKHIIRSKQQGFDSATTESFLVSGGRNLADWKLSQMVETKGISDLATELEGTPYLDIMKDALVQYQETKSIYALESAFDKVLLTTVREIESSALIAAGPTIKFIVAKEFEVRNLKAVLRGMHEQFAPDDIMPMLILED